MTPPRLPRRLLSLLLPSRVRDALLRDLDDEFARDVAPTRGVIAARRWYWRQAIGSIVPALRLRRRSGSRAISPPARRRVLADLACDVRIGARRLRREPAFAAAVTVTLAIGIGATTSMFAITHAVLLKDLPFHAADRLVTIAEVDTRRESSSGNVSYPDLLDYQTQNTTFDAIAGYSGGSRTIVGGNGLVDRVPMAEVTAGFFAMLGIAPAIGRDFADADYLPGAPPVVLLTDGVWRRRFGADRSIVGRALEMGGMRPTVVGVLPPDFEFPLRGLAEIWLPIQPTQAQLERRYMHWLDLIGRLAPNADRASAQADLDVIAARFAAVDPRFHAAARVKVATLQEGVAGPVRSVLLVLQAAAGFLLIVACANIGSLLVARGVMRSQELRVRAAIGAARPRLVRQLLAESLVMAVPGAAAGLAVGVIAVRAYVSWLPRAQRAALPHADAMGLSPEVMATAAGLGLLAAFGFGIGPAWQAGRCGTDAELRARDGAAPRDLRLQALFVAMQFALALVLLTGAGLLGRSVYRLLQVSPGFDPANVLTLEVNGQEPAYQRADAARVMHDTLLDRVASLPGVGGAATISQLPLAGRGNSGMFAMQREPARPDTSALIRTISPNYFDVMGVPLVDGRRFSHTDGPEAARVVLVNETLARTVFGGRAVGERISFPVFLGRPWWEIVGVVGDEQFVSLDRDMSPVVYFPYAQSVSNSFSIVVRTMTPPETLATPVRDVAHRFDPLLPVYQIETMEQILGRSDALYRRRSALALIAVFAIAAVALAAVGLYGVLAQTVIQRTRELGIRIALGADDFQIVRVVFRRALGLVGAGLCAGALVSALASQSLGSLLFGMRSLDATTLGAASACIGAVALMACLLPAVRALRIDPATALRGDPSMRS